MKKITLTFALLFLLFASFGTDIITLNNQKTFEGKVTKIKNCVVDFKLNGDKFSIPANDIAIIEFGDKNDKIYNKYIKLNLIEENNCLKGNLDANAFHGKKGGHFILGFLFGPFAIIGTALANPTPMKGKQTMSMSKNQELFTDPEYLVCYKKQAKAKLIGAEALGWAAWILLLLAF